LTIVCCIEAGSLEEQTLRMITSLRDFGGRFASSPVIAVVGRRGPKLLRATLERLRELKVEVCHAEPGDNPSPWFPYGNKAAAVVVAQREARTEAIAWLDSDIFVVREPTGLELGQAEDFAARSEFLPPAVVPGCRANVGYWSRVCDLFGLRFEDVPWVERDDGRPAQKMFFNSGVFVWRRATGFAGAYRAAFERLLASRLAQRDGDFHFIDQVILTPAVLNEKLRWRQLRQDEHFMIFQGFVDGPHAAPSMSGAELIHYSRSLDPPVRPRFLQRIERELPLFADWLAPRLGQSPRPRGSRAITLKMLKKFRGARWRLHARQVHHITDDGLRLPPPPSRLRAEAY
jgi:hypothetical protein